MSENELEDGGAVSSVPTQESSAREAAVLNSPVSVEDPQLQSKLDIRAYTRSTEEGRKMRAATAEKVRSERKQLRHVRGEIEAITENRDQMGAHIREQQDLIEQYSEKVESQRRELREREVKLARRAMGFFRLSNNDGVRGDITATESEIERTEQDLQAQYSEMRQMYDELQRLQYEKERLPKSTETLAKFYQEAGIELRNARERDALEKYKSERGTVEYLASSQNMYFLHGTNPNILGGQNNAFLKDGVSWEDKIAVVVEIRPTLSVSTIRERLGCMSLWSNVGVVLTGGKVEEASFSDSGTVTSGINTRTTSINTSRTVEDYKRNTSHASSWNRYNEFIVSDPQVAGLYINLDDSSRVSRNTIYTGYNSRGEKIDDIPFSEVQNVAEFYGMKVFGITGGQARTMNINIDTNEYTLGDVISPSEMLSFGYSIPEENSDEVREIAKSSLTPAALV